MTRDNTMNFMEMIEAMCARNPDSVRDIGQSDYDAFIALNDDQMEAVLFHLIMNMATVINKQFKDGLFDTEDTIFAFFKRFLGVISLGNIAFNEEGQFVFFKTVGDPPDTDTKRRIDGKIDQCRPLAITLFQDFLRQVHKHSSLTDDQHQRLLRLREECEEHNIEGVFNGNAELAPEQMAVQMWKLGYIALPTTQALIEGLEKDIENHKNGIVIPGAQYVFKWKMGFVLSDPKGVPVPYACIHELKEVIADWITAKGLQLEGDIVAGKYDELDDVEVVDDDDE